MAARAGALGNCQLYVVIYTCIQYTCIHVCLYTSMCVCNVQAFDHQHQQKEKSEGMHFTKMMMSFG